MTAAVDRLVAQSVDGLVVIVPQKSSADALRRLPSGLPVVAVEGNVPSRVSNVAVDQVEGARLAVVHLLELGHTTVHHVRGPGDWSEADAREEGWREALRSARRKTPRVIEGDWTAESGFRAGQELAQRADVTAVFVANDQMALGALRAFHERRVRIPRDLSVVGFDDIPEAGFLIPPLTTVRQDFDEVGRRSIRLLLSQIESPRRRRTRSLVPPRLIVRDTTAPPPTGTGSRRRL
jgi:DNA-binding LacI/PurR family transcriptional regulator